MCQFREFCLLSPNRGFTVLAGPLKSDVPFRQPDAAAGYELLHLL
jgi:hypothetical protein